MTERTRPALPGTTISAAEAAQINGTGALSLRRAMGATLSVETRVNLTIEGNQGVIKARITELTREEGAEWNIGLALCEA